MMMPATISPTTMGKERRRRREANKGTVKARPVISSSGRKGLWSIITLL